MRRSSNSPRYFEPAIRAPMSSATTRRSRSDSGMSPETIRWARPSAMAVLPTPGSPISTGLFFVRRREDLDDAADLVVAPDHRVELALLGRAGEVAPELLERLVLVLGALVGHAVRAADVRQRLEHRVLRGAVAPQRLAGLRAVAGQREQEVLGGDVLVAELAQASCSAPRRTCSSSRAVAGSSASPVIVGRASSAALTSARIASGRAPSLRSTGSDDAVGLLEQGREEVLRRGLGVAAARSERRRRRERLL